MYNTDKILNNDLECILEKIGEYNLYSHYIGSFKINHIFKSPLRNTDNNPSFGIFVSKSTNKLLFKDLATGETGNCIKFVKLFYRFDNYADTIEQIKKDFSNNSILTIDKRLYTKKPILSNNLTIKRKAFTKIDLDYWSSYGITMDTLIKYKVIPIEYLFINNTVCATYSTKEPMYCYTIFDKYKIYRPLSKKTEKWFGNSTSYDIQGFEQLPEQGDLLIITKALKDVMVLQELGYNAIAPNSESTVIPSVIMKNLKSRFTKIILFYDRDLGGLKGTRTMMKLYKLDFIFLPKYLKCKDISDLMKSQNKDINDILKQKIIHTRNL